MSTTSAADLLAHADQLTRQLRDSDVPISIQHWATFDVTVHRLMFELVGPGAMHEPGRPRTALAPTLAVFRSSPEPLRHPVNTQLSLRQAAALDENRGAGAPEAGPSADTLRMLANQGAHLYAVTHQVLTAASHDNFDDASFDAVSTSLAAGARAFRAADKPWEGLTTASRSSAGFVAASRELFNALNEVGAQASQPAHDWDGRRGMRDLSRGVETLRQVMELSQTLPDRLLRFGLVYAPARALPPSLARMRSQRQGRFVPVTREETPDLQALWSEAHRQARQVEHSLLRLDLHAGHCTASRSLEL